MGMKAIIMCLCVLLIQCVTPKPTMTFESRIIEPKQQIFKPKSFTARITYYSPNEKGYIYGTKIASNPKGKAVESYTVAVDPKKIPYGTIIYIPDLAETMGDGVFCAQDTGSSVKSLRAIPKVRRGEINIVIDVYVSSNETMNQLAKSMPHYMTVYIYE